MTVTERIQGVVVTVVAVLVGLSAVYTTFVRDRVPQPRRVELLEAIPADARLVMGAPTDSIHLVVLTDFECPACRAFHSTVKRLLAERSGVSLWYLHHPLPYHQHAMTAARVAECALGNDRFAALVDGLFEAQPEFGERSWAEIAWAAGISDTSRITRCASADSMPPAVAAGLAIGEAISLTGTPTVSINGWVFASPPSLGELEDAIEALAGGARPRARSRD